MPTATKHKSMLVEKCNSNTNKKPTLSKRSTKANATMSTKRKPKKNGQHGGTHPNNSAPNIQNAQQCTPIPAATAQIIAQCSVLQNSITNYVVQTQSEMNSGMQLKQVGNGMNKQSGAGFNAIMQTIKGAINCWTINITTMSNVFKLNMYCESIGTFMFMNRHTFNVKMVDGKVLNNLLKLLNVSESYYFSVDNGMLVCNNKGHQQKMKGAGKQVGGGAYVTIIWDPNGNGNKRVIEYHTNNTTTEWFIHMGQPYNPPPGYIVYDHTKLDCGDQFALFFHPILILGSAFIIPLLGIVLWIACNLSTN